MERINYMDNNRTKKKYYSNIRKLFPVNGNNEKLFLSNIKLQIEEYCSNTPEYSYQNLEEEFGTPIDIVMSYYENIESSYILSKINKKNTIKIFFITCLTLIFLFFSYRIYILQKAYDNFQKSIPATTTEIIVEETN